MTDHEDRATTDEEEAAARPVGDRHVRRRATRLQTATLAIVTVLAFGPLVAAFVVISGDSGPVTELMHGPPAPSDGALVTTTLTAVLPSTGELRARAVVQPREDLLEDGRPAVDLLLRVNDMRGQDTYVFPRGEPLQPVEVSLPLEGGSVVRYPFDDYRAELSMILSTDVGGVLEPVIVSMDVLSNVDQFDVAASKREGTTSLTSWSFVDLQVSREMTTTVYAVWMMVLMWGLAITGVLIVWALTIWEVEVPVWCFAYFVGVLFALPQLRELLPGRPAPGTVLDFVAFYWSIAIVGVSLIAALGIWIQRVRPPR